VHIFLYDAGTFTTIDAAAQFLGGLNDVGQIVGQFTDATGSHGFVYSAGSLRTIDVPGVRDTGALAINNAGQIVGVFFDPKGIGHGFLDVDGTLSTIDFPGAFFTDARGINDAGDIVGNIDVDILPIPEPSSLTLLSIGLCALSLSFRRRVAGTQVLV
jgi:uncharacterized membrane protein